MTDLRSQIETAYSDHFAIGAFNVYNLETVQAVCRAAEESGKPVFLQTSESALEYAGFEQLVGIIERAKLEQKTPIYLHLDHGRDPKLIEKCIKAGYDSVMFDGSKLPFSENVSISKDLRRLAHRNGVIFEAEIGRIGGHEDRIVSSKNFKTDPAQAVEFYESVLPDILAVAIGNIHGEDVIHEELDFSLLARLSDLLKCPLVLHGCSNRAPREYKVAIAEGVVKINIDTELRQAALYGIELALKKKIKNPREVLGLMGEEISKQTKEKIEIFSCAQQNC